MGCAHAPITFEACKEIDNHENQVVIWTCINRHSFFCHPKEVADGSTSCARAYLRGLMFYVFGTTISLQLDRVLHPGTDCRQQ